MRLHGTFVLLFVLTLTSVESQSPAASWPQWGGPNRNFVIEAPAFGKPWPSEGPRQLWSRTLGEGHSSIVEDRGRLFTSYRPAGMLSVIRRAQEEATGAFDASTGKTIWEYRYPAPTSDVDFSAGAGPHSTPLVSGGLVFAASSLKQIFALSRDSGALIWSHDLIREYGASPPGRGYTCSPLQYRDTIVVSAGGKPGQSLMAFNRKTGALVWKAGDFDPAPASPIVIDVGGQPQLIALGGDRIVGLDPSNGALLWSHPHSTQYGLNISTPVWSGSELFISSAYNGGSRLLQLTRQDGKTNVKEVWFTNRMRVHFGSVVRIDDHLYGSSGDFGPAFLVAVDAKTGRVAWQDRGFARAQLVNAGPAVVLLDEDGTLGLVKFSPKGLTTVSRAPVMEATSWTPPTVVGMRIYLRDRKNMVALSVG
jgi:outer membrane protein assembly factor BamB